MRHLYQYFYLHLQLTCYRYRMVYRLQVRDTLINSNKKNYFENNGGLSLSLSLSLARAGPFNKISIF